MSMWSCTVYTEITLLNALGKELCSVSTNMMQLCCVCASGWFCVYVWTGLSVYRVNISLNVWPNSFTIWDLSSERYRIVFWNFQSIVNLTINNIFLVVHTLDITNKCRSNTIICLHSFLSCFGILCRLKYPLLKEYHAVWIIVMEPIMEQPRLYPCWWCDSSHHCHSPEE